MQQKPHVYLFKSIILLGVYFITAKIGLGLDAVSGFAALIWVPTGISLVALVLWGFSYWPAIALGAFLANFTQGAPLLVAGGIGIGNMLEALMGAFLLKRFIHFHTNLDRLMDVLGLVLYAGILSTFLSATIGVMSLFLGGVIPHSALIATWSAWWVGDMISNLIVAPLLFVWSTKPFFIKQPKKITEAVLLWIIVVGIGLVVFLGLFGIWMIDSPVTYLVFPPLIWAALRFGQRETVTAIFLLSVIAVWSTVLGSGPFVRQQLSESLLLLQTFMAVIAVTPMILAAVVSERTQLEKRKDDFISMASHELKTPLVSIKSYAQVLQKQLKPAKDKKSQSLSYFLSQIDGQTDKMNAIINDLLDVSKIQSGKLELRQNKINFDVLIKDTVANLQQVAQTHTIIIDGETKKKIVGDEYRLGQVLTNLLANAIKYSPKAQKVIIRCTSNTRWVTVDVQDFGRGISQEEQSKIFEPFYRVEGVRVSGLGLGLHIASEIVRRHGGEIWVESKRGKGATFFFRLPLRRLRERVLYKKLTKKPYG